MFNSLPDDHKNTLKSALDHIDGILGDAMSKARSHLKAGDPNSPKVDPAKTGSDDESLEGKQPASEEKYEGQSKPGGHAGHSFGASKDQKGQNNSHFGKTKDGSGIPKRRNDGGLEAFKALISK